MGDGWISMVPLAQFLQHKQARRLFFLTYFYALKDIVFTLKVAKRPSLFTFQNQHLD